MLLEILNDVPTEVIEGAKLTLCTLIGWLIGKLFKRKNKAENGEPIN
jgi:hypothetical protein